MSKPLMQLKQVGLKTGVGSGCLLEQISLAIFESDRLALVGSTGAGKTSLLRLLNRLEESTAGVIELENRPLSQISAVQLRQQVVLVPQEPKLLGMTVAKALAYPLTLQQLPSQEINQRLETWQSRLRIPSAWLERNELQLSLGQRQTVAIARALIMQPKILLLDEPTSALDFSSALALIELLGQLTQQTPLAVVMVNHQLDLVEQFAHRLLYLQDGRLLQDAATDAVDWNDLRDCLKRSQAQAVEEWT